MSLSVSLLIQFRILPPLVPVVFRRCHSAKWEKAMATHSSTLAWKIPSTEEPDRLQSMGSLGVRHD